MRLKRMVVRGFKSFADRTEFDFDADLTGIVGPNGCGKSNVVDALKWVLGDQRAKSLRGSEMTDVIFKGAEGRDALEVAEVTIHLENDLPGETDDERLAGVTELSIGRRLNREKESSYLLNGEVVRLKDVRDLLMGTGLGVGAYSVMEQGRIDAVLSANPDDRRAIFEEAAGISRFKLQKRETLRKLERTEQNLARVKDLLEERGRRIRSLKIQAGRARRWREIQARLRDVRSALAVHDARGLRETEVREIAERSELERMLEAVAVDIERRRTQLTEVDEGIVEAEAGLSAAQDDLRVATSRLDAERHKAEALDQRGEELSDDAESCVARAGTLRDQRGQKQSELGDARERLTELEAELVDLAKQTDQRRDDVKAAGDRVRDLQTQREQAREAMLELIHERTRLRNEAHDQAATLRSAMARLERIDDRLIALEREVAERTEEQGTLSRVLEDLAQRNAWLDGEERLALGELEAADSEAAALTRLESGLRERTASVSSRLEVLQGMEAHHEGLDQGPKFLLEEGPEGLIGPLLDQVRVDLEYSRALEAALGPHVQALVVDTRKHAEQMLARLRDTGHGRALLLIAEEFGDRLESSGPFSLPDDAEYLIHRVRCRAEAWPMVQWLLRGVCVVDDMEQARPDRTDLCFVTKHGSVVCGPRLEGGQIAEGQAGLVVRRAQIESLGVEERELGVQLDDLQVDMSAVAGRVEQLDSRARRIGGIRQRVGQREQATIAERGRLHARMGDLAREGEELAMERRDLSRDRFAALGRLGDRLLGEVLVRRQEARSAEAEQRVADELESVRGAAEAAQRAEQEVRVRQATVRTDRDAQVHRIDALDGHLRELGEALDELEGRREEARSGAERARAEALSCRERASEVQSEIAELEAARAEAATGLGEERERKQEEQDRLREVEQSRSDFQDQLAQKRLDLSDVQHRFQRLEDRLREETDIELRRLLGEVVGFGLVPFTLAGPTAPLGSVECLSGPPLPPSMLEPALELQPIWEHEDFDLDAVRKEAQILQAQRERLGAVNLDAMGELDDEEHKFGSLERDVSDLGESRRSLIEALRQMEAESRTLFEKTFEQARENFRSIFRKLFQGGRADMYLADSDDALESGIEIVAKPPGKELQSIALLSGGERSLTALAILFAVFKVKPSPFCILDEVDAALDETNVERFLRVLGDFVGPSQFCIVTHHKRTMAECQVLYGITMQKRGVSTRLSVAVGEVDEFSEKPSFERADRPRIAGEEHVGF